MWKPREEYEIRLKARLEKLEERTREDFSISVLRGIVAAIFLLFLILAFYSHRISSLWLVLPTVIFAILIVLHERVIRAKARAARAVKYYEHGIARIEDRWQGFEKAETGARFLDPQHPYSQDLDIFGSGSLYQLLCSARTQAGEERLAEWVKSPADVETICNRQDAVRELRTELDFREELALIGTEVRHELQADALNRWAQAPSVKFSTALRSAMILLPLLAIFSIWGWGFGNFGPAPFFLVIALEWGITSKARKRARHITHDAEAEHHELKLLAHALKCFESHPPFESAQLLKLIKELHVDGLSPSRQIARLDFLLDLLDWQRNQLFAPIAIVLLWELHLAIAIESWRHHFGPSIRKWISIVGEFEALSSLATYSYEHPADPFPQIVKEERCFEGKELGHPLIPVSANVRNDVTLNSESPLLIVSGSNMSGKSTLLRTIGINTVLALAGAPVRAANLRISPLSIGACIFLVDSLQAHTSRFYAEIKRLRQLAELAAGSFPLLFLLDEILHGTNSKDRLSGAEAVIRGFLKRGAIGAITTHDLALTEIAERLGIAGANIHFQDDVKDGQITFDYKIHPGVVQKSNAIELMRSIGLDV
jgi:hypothetical protein